MVIRTGGAQELIKEDGELREFDMINVADHTPLVYTSACEAFIRFGEQVDKAMQKNPSQADVDATFQV